MITRLAVLTAAGELFMDLSAINWGAILGGFGLFMFGIKFMGDGLKAVAGDALRDYINAIREQRQIKQAIQSDDELLAIAEQMKKKKGLGG